MLVLLLVLLMTVDIGYGLQCMTNCSVGKIPFGQPFRISDGQCHQLISASTCSVELTLTYHDQMYSVDFSNSLPWALDFIYITSGPYLSYNINYRCSQGTDCVLSYVQNRINEMVGRPYDAKRIYDQLAPLIENPTQNNSIQCYNTQNEIITCSPNKICAVDYDQQAKTVRSRGCVSSFGVKLSVYDSGSYLSIEVNCARSLCNNDTTLAQIKTILVNSGLTDSNGRRIAAGTKGMVSSLLMTFTLISIIVSYF